MIHSYDPCNGGVKGNASGLWWTVPVLDSTVTTAPGTGSIMMDSLPILDHFQEGALTGALGTLNLTATWGNDIRAIGFKGTTQGSLHHFAGQRCLLSTSFTVSSQVSATNWAPFEFTAGTINTVYAMVGHETNGIYTT
jgi:hypothetical protein